MKVKATEIVLKLISVFMYGVDGLTARGWREVLGWGGGVGGGLQYETDEDAVA